MDLVRAADGRRTRLGQSQRPYLALLDEPLHRAHRLLDRHLGIDAVLVIEIDRVNAEALQARLAGAHHVLGPAVDILLSLRSLHLAELGGDDDAVAPAAQRSSEQLLVVPPAVHVGRVEEVDAFVERVVNDANRLFVIRDPVDARHRHEPEADGGDFERAASNLALFHGLPLFPFADGRKTWSVPDFRTNRSTRG